MGSNESSAVESDDGDGFLDEDANEDATDNGETSGSVLAPWEGGEFTELTLDVPVTADVSTGEKWFSFTPGKSGLYKFAASDPESADPYGYLYDANGNELASDDDSAGDSCFLIQRFLDADEVYYLKASTFASNEGESYLVAVGETDTYDFGGYYLNYGNTYLTVGADPLEAMEVSFSCKVDSSVALPEDAYTTQLWRYNEDQGEYETVDGLDEPGDYRIVFTPVDPYYGSDKEIDFNVFAQNDLAIAKVAIEPLIVNGEVLHPSYTVTVGGVELEEGTHYTAKWTCYDEDRGESVVVDGPSELDTYYNFTITAVEGSGYDGALSTGYSLNDRPYISEVIDWPNGHSFAKTGEPVVPEVVLTWNGEALTEGVDYEVSYYSEDADIYEEDALPEAPTEIGTYQVMFTGKGSFQGTYSDWFYIERSYDAHDLYYASANVIGGSFVVGQMPEDFGAEVWQCDEDGSYLDDEPLREDEDYVVTYQRYAGEEDGTELWDDVDFDGTVPGRYQMKITGVEPYFGTCYAYFFDVYAANDLAIADVVVDEKSLVLVNGKATPSVTVYLDDEVVDPAEYEVRYSKSEDEGLLELPLTQAGWYDLFVVAKEGGAYTGESHSEVLVTLSTDLSRAQIELENSELDYTGQPVELSATVTSAAGDVLTLGEDYKLLYITEDDYSDWEGEEGVWSEQAPSESGEYYVRAQGLGQYEGETHSVQFVIVDPYDIGNTWTSLSYGTDYLVEGQFPDDFAVHVYLPDEDEDGDSVRLEEGEDFSVVYERLKADDADEDDAAWEAVEDIAAQPAGEYRAVIEGVAPYHGKKYREFTIHAATDLAIASVIVNDDEGAIPFTGDGACPTTVVELDGKVLTEGVHYTVEYRKDGNYDDVYTAPLGIGHYETRIVAKEGSGYQGERSADWISVAAPTDLAYASIESHAYTYAENDKPVQLDFTATAIDGTLLRAGADYRVLYISEEDYWNDEDEVWTKEAPSKVGKYRFRIEGQGDYEGVSGNQSFEIIDTHDLGNLNAYAQYSDGDLVAGHFPDDFTVVMDSYDGDNELTLGKDYEIVGYEFYDEDADEWVAIGGIDAITKGGEYRAVIEGVAPYHGACTCSFEVYAANDLHLAVVDGDSTYVVDSDTASVTPELQVTMDDKPLTPSLHYNVEFYEEDSDDAVAAPLKPGSYYARISAIDGSGYVGSRWFYFRVLNRYDLDNASFRIVNAYAATGDPVQLELRSADSYEGEELTAGTDFEWAYFDESDNPLASAPSAVGDYYVAMMGKGKYSGESYYHSFRIVKPTDLVLASASCVGYVAQFADSDEWVYIATGSAVDLGLTLKLGSKTLRAGSDYVVEYRVEDDDEDDSWTATPPSEIGYYDVRITAASGSKYSGTKWMSLTIVSSQDLDYGGSIDIVGNREFVYDGQEHVPSVEVSTATGKKLAEDDYRFVLYRLDSDDGEWYRVDACVEPGTYGIAAEGIGDYCGSTGWTEFCILENLIPLDDATIALSETSFTYNAKVQKPTVASVTLDGEALEEDADFTVSYSNADSTDTGSYIVTVTGVGKYAGTVTASYEIGKASIANAKLALVKASYTYNGKAQKPAVKTVGGKALKAGTDYTVTYSNANSKDAGSYTITVTGKGNYAGTSAKATYKIAKAKNPLAVKAVAKSVKAKAAKKKAQVVSGGVKVTKKGIGAVTYAKVAKGSAKQLTVNKKNGKITVKKGTKKGTYKVKVKVTAKGNKNYQSASKTVTVTVKVK